VGIPLSGVNPRERPGLEIWDADGRSLFNEPTPEADSYGVGSTSRLKLRQEMADVGLHRLLGEEEPLADLSVDEAVCDELKYLDLASGRILSDLAGGRRREGDHGAAAAGAATRSRGFEPPAVVAISVEDLLALSGVHEFRIGARPVPL
jgi:hypothetical protein